MASASAPSAAAAAKRAGERITWMFTNLGKEDYIGEPVSVLQHSWQAYERARGNDESEDTQVACLLHDVGHLLGMEAGFEPGMDGCGTPNHEQKGGDFLRSLGCSEETSYLVSQHVNAKRYLVYKYKDYELSEASRITLSHQGGPMTAAEAAEFEANPLFKNVLRMRTYDEQAKIADKVPATPDQIGQIVEQHVLKNLSQVAAADVKVPVYSVSPEQLRFYNEHGYLVVHGHSGVAKLPLQDAADDLAQLPDSDAYPWLVHDEVVELPAEDGTLKESVQPARVENYVRFHDVWSQVNQFAAEIATQLFGEKALLFKDKMNFKGPGGGGFDAHQDATAYGTDSLALKHISVMVAVDSVDEEMGPLEFANGTTHHHDLSIVPHTKGVIKKSSEDTMKFQKFLAKEGDIVLFSSYVPHRSASNTTTNRPRRAAFLTYNPASQGDLHSKYYAMKKRVVDAGEGGTISVNDDFRGKIVHRKPRAKL